LGRFLKDTLRLDDGLVAFRFFAKDMPPFKKKFYAFLLSITII
jgi:hypothetical protein